MALNTEADARAPAVSRRQRPGPACDECRRRKLRCDGQQPQCRVCQERGVVCEVTQRGVRGPKKGHLKALKNRVVHLEALLENRFPAQQQQPQQDIQDNTQSSNELMPSASSIDVADTAVVDTSEPWLPNATTSFPGAISPDFSSWFSATLPVSSINIPPDAFFQDELYQLYLDRVHQSIPILHQRRYLLWSKSSTKTAQQRCLQYAMWTVASLLSAQFRDITEPLYQQTRQMLEYLSVDGNEHNNISTQLAQAWVLVVTFESMRAYHRQAWMSAGRAFRLVQAMRYHEIDSPIDKRGFSSPQCGDLIEVEEKRRVFWMAYFLDHVISMRDDWPITPNEHAIYTRLPAPDAEFQSGQYELGLFLSEAMAEPTLNVRSSFNECLILATICGRSLLQSQRYHIAEAYGDMTLDWAEQRPWLDTLLTTRLQVMMQCYPSPAKAYDPLLLFVHILSQASMIYFYKTMAESAARRSINTVQGNSGVSCYKSRALEASATIIRLAMTLCELPFSKIHPLMPIPLFLCAEFLYANVHSGEIFQLRLQELLHIFRELKNVNNHQQSYLDLLPQLCIPKSNELFGHGVAGSDLN